MKTRKKPKKAVILLIAVIVALIVILCIVMEIDYQRRLQVVKLDSGEEIVFNQQGNGFGSTSQIFDEKYQVLPVEEDTAGLVKAAIPEHAVNLRHYIQKTVDDGDDYDEIYQWETEVYGDRQSTVLDLCWNSGTRYEIADRGYMEFSIFETRPQRVNLDSKYKEISAIKSSINGKRCIVKERNGEYRNGSRSDYSAEIQDFDEKGHQGLLFAENVTRDYFLQILAQLTGYEGSWPKESPSDDTAEPAGAEAMKLAKEEIAFRNAAEKMAYDEIKRELGHVPSELSITSWYEKEPRTHFETGKKYNIHLECIAEDKIFDDWYMYLEKRDGKFVEAEETLRVSP